MVKIKIEATDAQIRKLMQGKTVQLKHSQLGSGKTIDLHPENAKRVLKSMKSNTGVRLCLAPHEIISGEGIFGKKVDKFLQKKGIKKAVYATGAAFKPLAHELIKSAGQMADTYAPGLGTMGANLASSYIDHPEKYQEMYKNRNDGPGIDQGALGTAFGTKAAEMLTAKMAERAAKQQAGGRIRRARGCGLTGGAINPYMPKSLSGGAIARPAIHLRNDQSNFITANSPSFFPIQPRTVKEFQTGGSFRI